AGNGEGCFTLVGGSDKNNLHIAPGSAIAIVTDPNANNNVLSFDIADKGVTFNLGVQETAQVVNDRGDTVSLKGWVNVLQGSGFKDNFIIDPRVAGLDGNVTISVDGGLGDDVITVDGGLDGNNTISVDGGLGP